MRTRIAVAVAATLALLLYTCASRSSKAISCDVQTAVAENRMQRSASRSMSAEARDADARDDREVALRTARASIGRVRHRRGGDDHRDGRDDPVDLWQAVLLSCIVV